MSQSQFTTATSSHLTDRNKQSKKNVCISTDTEKHHVLSGNTTVPSVTRKKSLTPISITEIERHYAKKAQKGPHLIGDYAAVERLTGLTEKQLAQCLASLTIGGEHADSPYAQPVCNIPGIPLKYQQHGRTKNRVRQFTENKNYALLTDGKERNLTSRIQSGSSKGFLPQLHNNSRVENQGALTCQHHQRNKSVCLPAVSNNIHTPVQSRKVEQLHLPMLDMHRNTSARRNTSDCLPSPVRHKTRLLHRNTSARRNTSDCLPSPVRRKTRLLSLSQMSRGTRKLTFNDISIIPHKRLQVLFKQTLEDYGYQATNVPSNLHIPIPSQWLEIINELNSVTA